MCRGEIVGRRRIHVPWWRVLWFRITGNWANFMAFIEHADQADLLPCPVCRASGHDPCDAALHS